MTHPPPTRTRALLLALMTTIYLGAIGLVAINKFTTLMTNSTCDIVAMVIVCTSCWYVAEELISATYRHFVAIKASGESDVARVIVAAHVEHSAKPLLGSALAATHMLAHSVEVGDAILITSPTIPVSMNGIYGVATILPDNEKVIITLERAARSSSNDSRPVE